MRNIIKIYLILLNCFLFGGHAAQQDSLTRLRAPSSHLRITAVVNDEIPPYDARLECWQLDEPFDKYPTVGSALLLGDVSNITYVILPTQSQEGLHHPPHPMFFVLLSGIAHVTLPADPQSPGLWIVEGRNPLIVATDVLGDGHYTAYPGDKPSVALQIPFHNGIEPAHKVVRQESCDYDAEPAWKHNYGPFKLQ